MDVDGVYGGGVDLDEDVVGEWLGWNGGVCKGEGGWVGCCCVCPGFDFCFGGHCGGGCLVFGR